MENQADCIAGAWLARQDELGRVYPDDYADVGKIVELIASSEDDPNRDHGTLSERVASVQLGLRQGIRACNSYFPGVPVIG